MFTWPDGGMTPFRGDQGNGDRGWVPCAVLIRWPGQIKPGTVEMGNSLRVYWFPTTMLAAAGNPNITEQLLKGVKLGDRNTKMAWTAMTRLTCSPGKRHIFRSHKDTFYFGGRTRAVPIDDFKYQFFRQKPRVAGRKVTTDMPTIVNHAQTPLSESFHLRGAT